MGEVEVGEEMDEESTSSNVLSVFLSDRVEAAAKHAEFVRARGRHYSNEAEAMKVIILLSTLTHLN
jgi:protein phosphatase inhibitor 2